MSKETKIDSRDALLTAGKSLFAHRGFDGTTVKDLADAAGVNVSLVSYHFGGKENLYRACLEGFGRDRLAATERLLKPCATLTEFELRLTLFAEDFVESHLLNRDVCTIIHRDFDGGNPIALEVFYEVFMKMYEHLRGFVGAAQVGGMLRPDLDLDISTGLMFGGLIHSLRADPCRLQMGQQTIDDPAFRAQLVLHFVRNAVHGLCASEANATPKKQDVHGTRSSK